MCRERAKQWGSAKTYSMRVRSKVGTGPEGELFASSFPTYDLKRLTYKLSSGRHSSLPSISRSVGTSPNAERVAFEKPQLRVAYCKVSNPRQTCDVRPFGTSDCKPHLSFRVARQRHPKNGTH